MTLINLYMLNIHQTEKLARVCNACGFTGHALQTHTSEAHCVEIKIKVLSGVCNSAPIYSFSHNIFKEWQGRLNHLLARICNPCLSFRRLFPAVKRSPSAKFRTTFAQQTFPLLVILYLCIQPRTLHAQNDIVLKDPVFGNTSVTAPNSITLSAGFTTIPGSVFTASIGPAQTTGGAAVISSPSASATPAAGTTGQNFIKSITYRDAQTTVPTGNFNHNEVIQYFDGLGRPMQTVNVGASPSGNDIIQPTLYDNYGREAIQTLPYTGAKTGEFRTGVTEATVNDYYRSGSALKPAGILTNSPERAYTQIGFEASPLNRVLTQTGPGANWATKPASFNYLTNTVTKPGWAVTGDYTYSSFSYRLNSLYVTESIDEDGHTTREYKDKQGQVVLKESLLDGNWLRTAYIYDDFGLLRCVVPPLATSPTDQALCYYYLYDSRHRMVEKKLPGGGTTKMVYDQRDRLRCTQNNEQSLTHDWSFTKYDELNRPVISGLLRNYTSDIVAAVTSGTISETQNNVKSTKGYTNVSFPGSTLTPEIQSVTFYDDYSFISPMGLGDSLTYENYTDEYNVASKKDDAPKGRVTGTMTSVLQGETDTPIKTELYSTMYYDKYGHVLRAISENHLGGKDVSSNNYEDITWLVTQTRQEHYKGAENIIIDKTMEYDHTGRLLATRQKVNTQDEITLNAMQYNEVGELITKYLHSGQTYGNRSFLQKVDYWYNIRGWLRSINDPSLSSGNDLFGMSLYYEDPINKGVPGGSRLYNGNIVSMQWAIKNDKIRGYYFTYDGLNRMQQAMYAEQASFDTNVNYFNEAASYDNNGNITGLSRWYNNSMVDNLSYAYINTNKSNQIQKITDFGTPNANVDDYPGTSSTYTYDTNGNMHFDGARNTTLYYHPTLNLPKQIDFGNNNLIYYSYTATGNKLVKHVQSGNGSVHNYTHYIGNVVYENGTLSYISTEEGRLVAIGTGTDRRFINEYELKDHLGNTRVSFMGTNLGGAIDVVQTTNYYPFGLVMTQTNTNTDPSYAKNKYLYNGKELQDDNLNGTFFGMLDYGARFYDPQIARWHVIDPFAEVYVALAPYHYAANNPINIVDVKGKLLKDKDGNIIATSTGNIVTRSDENKGWKATYQEVTIYTDEGTPITALNMIEQSVSNNDGTTDAKTNCHGWALGGGSLYIMDNNGAVNTILKEDGYVQVDDPAEADVFIEAFSKTDPKTGKEIRADKDVWHTGKHDKENDTYSADHGDEKPTENGTLESASTDFKKNPGAKTFFFKATKPKNLEKAKVKVISKEEAEEERKKALNNKK